MRFFVFLAVFLGLIALAVWGLVSLFSSPKTYTLGYGMLQDAARYNAILVREEHVQGLASYSKVIYTATENQNVNQGDEILSYYVATYSDDTLRGLEDIRRQIEEYQRENLLTDVTNTDLDRYDEQITLKIGQIRDFVAGQEREPAERLVLVDLERDLRAFMSQRREYIRTSQSFSGDSQLEALYEEEKRQTAIIDAWMDTFPAPVAGRVSYIFDGYEHALTTQALPNLTVEAVDELIKSAEPPRRAAEQMDTAPPIFRIVNPASWSVLLTAQDSEWKFAEDATVDISFEGFENLPFVATVQRVAGNAEMVLVELDVEEDMGPLINARKLTAILGGRIEGLMVPLSAIKEIGSTQVVYLADEANTAVQVKVEGKDDKYALVMPVTEGELAPRMEIMAR